MSAIEITAHDVETAIKIGLAQIGLLRAEVKIEVLDEGNKGVLGIGVRAARVRLTPFAEIEARAAAGRTAESPAAAEAPATPKAPEVTEEYVEEPEQPVEAEAAPVTDAVPEAEAASAESSESEPEAEDERDIISEEAEQLAATLTQGVLDRMDFQVTCTSRIMEAKGNNENPSIWVDIQGKDASRLLAHQCEALDSLQLVVQTMWAHQTKSNMRVTLDADSYKERREKRIQQMALRLAERVISDGRAITLEPMPASERRLVHIALREHPQVTTESHGEGSGRRITIRMK